MAYGSALHPALLSRRSSDHPDERGDENLRHARHMFGMEFRTSFPDRRTRNPCHSSHPNPIQRTCRLPEPTAATRLHVRDPLPRASGPGYQILGKESSCFTFISTGSVQARQRENDAIASRKKQLYACLFAGVNPNISRPGLCEPMAFRLHV